MVHCVLCFHSNVYCRIELDIQGGLSPRPMMSVPHILADESSCYYHGYVLAEMSVHQVRSIDITMHRRFHNILCKAVRAD
jgi:hypothetical protein